ncbi:MAG: FAD-binding oxidoreductase [Actinomycetota bacterium]|nr:FAD-binding oxidoreductase [Actinomycetota bacterium]
MPLWRDTAGEPPGHRPPLTGDTAADVVVVGAGFTGLWTAYYLLRAAPGLRVVVVESSTAGFGASGRNGGWCSALFPRSVPALARRHGRAAALAQQQAMRATVDEVAAVVDREGIDCHLAKGGTVAVARTPAQLARAEREVAQARAWGGTPADVELLGPEEVRKHVRATGALGGTYTPHCAAVQPLRLVRGLAAAVEHRGCVLHEHTPVTAIESGGVRTTYGRVRARVVVRATEGYTAGLPGQRRRLAPVYSLMLATEPLPPSAWTGIGLERRQTFTDFRHLLVYGQRTADDRVAFGGRGAPYHFGSRVRPSFDQDPRVFAALRSTLVELFPVLAEARVTHTWGGPLGVPRDWCASVGLDRSTGIGWAGGYVGDGVGTSNLAGRTLADLILSRDTDLVRLPWVGHRSPRWEPEPLRWLGINAGLRLTAAADVEERRTGRPSRLAAAAAPLLGGH